jgi:hypothetical protein
VKPFLNLTKKSTKNLKVKAKPTWSQPPRNPSRKRMTRSKSSALPL